MKNIIYGTMGLGGAWDQEEPSEQDYIKAEQVIDKVLSMGITHFDLADIYSRGKSEKVFGQYLRKYPEKRENLIIQSKLGIDLSKAVTSYNFTEEYIEKKLDDILERLHINCLDILILHRPDPLADIKKTAEVLKRLKSEGKFKKLGVSNMSYHQMDLLSHYYGELYCNQLEMSLDKIDFVSHSIQHNAGLGKTDFPEGTIEYCIKHGVELQAWGSMARGMFSGNTPAIHLEEQEDTREEVKRLASVLEVSEESIVLAWLLKHPANIKPVVGTTNIERLYKLMDLSKVNLSYEAWYSLLSKRLGRLIP